MLSFLVVASLIGLSQCQTFSPLCYDPFRMAAAQQKCYSDQGLTLHMAADPNNLDHIKDAAKNNAMTSSPEFVCKNQDAYDKAIHCSIQLSLMCTYPGYENYLPSEDNLKQAQNIMCNNLHGERLENMGLVSADRFETSVSPRTRCMFTPALRLDCFHEMFPVLDHDCTINKTEALVDCGQRKYGEMTVADAMDPYKSTCLAYEHAEECLEEEIAECGQETVELQKQFNQLQKPIICQGTSIGK